MADVFVGGVQGFSSLATASATATLRATGRVGLYQHANAIQTAFNDGSLGAIVQAFSSDGRGMAELPLIANPATWFANFYQAVFTNSGLTPSTAIVDVGSSVIDASAWAAYVSAARTAGISVVAPIFSPNDANDPFGDFATLPAYASLRAAAMLGGGITLDSPPGYALERGSAYLGTIESELRWAKSHGLTATVILSPTTADYESSFLQDTASFIAHLASAGALPDAWVVESYDVSGTTFIGSENDPQSVAGVALWVAQNVDTPSSIAASTGPLSWTTPVHVAVGANMAPGSSNLGTSTPSYALSIIDSGGQAHVTGGTGGLALNSSGAADEVWTAAGSTNVIVTGVSATVDSRGLDHVTVGSGSTVTIEGVASVTGGSTSSYFHVSGTATLLSQASDGDVIQAVAGATLNLTNTGNYFTLFDLGASVHVHEAATTDNIVADISGGGATIYGGAGHGLTVVTTAGLATGVALGVGNTYLVAAGNDTVSGGSGGNTVILQGNDTVTGGTGSSYYVVSGSTTLLSQSAGSDVIQAVAGATLNLTNTGHYFTLFDAGAAVQVHEAAGTDNIGATLAGGGATIYGGTGHGLTVVTTAGLATNVALGAGSTYLVAKGNDSITGGSGDNTVVLQGNTTVSGSTGSSYYAVSGATTLLSQSAGADTIQAVAGATLNATVTGHYFTLFDAGATVHVHEAASGDNIVADLTGGGATLYGGAGHGLTLVTTAGLATNVALGAGNTYLVAKGNDSVTGGSGDNTVVLQGNTTVSGSTGSSYYVVSGSTTLLSQSGGSDVIQAVAGATLNFTNTGHYFTLFDAGANLQLHEAAGSDNIGVNLAGGGATLYGGAGHGLTVVTTAGLATNVALGTGNTYLVAKGNDSVSGGSGDNTVVLQGNSTVIGSTGSSYYVVSGSTTLLSQSAGSDVIQAVAGATLNLTNTGHYFTLFDAGAAVQIHEAAGTDNISATLAGGGATLYGGAGHGLTVVTTTGLSTNVALGTGNTYLVAKGNDSVSGGSGDNTVVLQGNTAVTGSTGSSYYVVSGSTTLLSQSGGADVIQAVAGATLNLTSTGHYFTLFDAGAAVQVHEAAGQDNIGASLAGGGATIYGGAGTGLTISTTAGLATAVTLGAGSAYLISRGNDTITGGTGNETIVLQGAATITGGTGANYYAVSGNTTLLSHSTTSDVIQAAATATLNLTNTGSYFTLFDVSATVHVHEAAGSDNIAADVAGGGATIYGGAGHGLTIDTTAGLSTTIALGTGSTTVVSRGTDTITASANSTATVNLVGPAVTIVSTGATVNLYETGGSGSVNLAGGGATVTGGTAAGLTVNTVAGAATKVTVGGGASIVHSLGADTIFGGSGQLTFIGGSGSTTVTGGTGALSVQAGSGNLTVNGSGAGDILHAGSGLDTFYLGNGVNAAYLGAGNATVTGGAGSNAYHIAAGTGARTIEIKNFLVGRDSCDFNGFTGSAIASQTVATGSLTMRLNDGAQVLFDGITKPF